MATITNTTDARAIINSSVTLSLPVPASVLADLGAADLRTLARRAGLAAHFASMGDKSLLCSILSGDTLAEDWSLSSAGDWVRTTTTPTPTPTPTHASTDLLGALGETLTRAARVAAQARIDEIVAEQGFTRPIVLKTLEGAEIEIGADEHPALVDLLKRDRCVPDDKRNYLLVGPAGTGKTTIAKRFAEILGVDFGFLSCSAGLSESALLGRVRPFADPGSDAEYARSDFVRQYTEGGVMLLDELDAADPNTMLVINAALDNGQISVPLACKIFDRAPGARVLGACNTWGTGADRQYTGREAFDAAGLDRYSMRIIAVDYDRALERRILEAYLPSDASLVDRAIETVRGVRAVIDETKIRRIMSTRTVVMFGAYARGGYSPKECMAMFTTGWSEDERAKIEAGVSL